MPQINQTTIINSMNAVTGQNSRNAFKVKNGLSGGIFWCEAQVIPGKITDNTTLKLPFANRSHLDVIETLEYKIPRAKINLDPRVKVVINKKLCSDEIIITKSMTFSPTKVSRYTPEDLNPVGISKPYGSTWEIFDEQEVPNVQKQNYDTNCGQACVSMIFNGRITQDEVGTYLGTHSNTQYHQIESALNHYDSSKAVKWTHTYKNTEKLCQKDVQGIASDNVKLKKPWLVSLANCADGTHFVIIDHYDQQNKVFTIRCSSAAAQFKMKLDEFTKLWTGHMICPTPKN